MVTLDMFDVGVAGDRPIWAKRAVGGVVDRVFGAQTREPRTPCVELKQAGVARIERREIERCRIREFARRQAERRSFDLDDRLIGCLLAHVLSLFLSDSVFAESRRDACGFALLTHHALDRRSRGQSHSERPRHPLVHLPQAFAEHRL